MVVGGLVGGGGGGEGGKLRLDELLASSTD